MPRSRKAVYKCWVLDEVEPEDYDRSGGLFYVYGTEYQARKIAALDYFSVRPEQIALREDSALSPYEDLRYYYDADHFQLKNAGYDEISMWNP